MACQFRGDPNDDHYQKWRARTLKRMSQIDQGSNVYLCVSAMQQNERGEYRRRKENFAGGLLLMIDDIGEGLGAKFPMSIIDPLPPTCLVETSPDNYQAMYFFNELVTDQEKFDALIRAFIEKQFLGADTGQASVNRVFRPPVGVNGKPKYKVDSKPWQVRMAAWEPENRYSMGQIANAFGLDVRPRVARIRHEGTLNSVKGDRIRNFIDVRQALRAAGMIKREEPDYSGWIQIRCPWTENHTGEADNGAAIRVPEIENEWFGAFRCHHGHCKGMGFKELTQFLNDHFEDILFDINENSPEKLLFFNRGK